MEAQTAIKVVALCGSLRKGSYNRGLLRSAMEISKSIKGMEIEYVDISPLPFLNTDLEVDGTYPPVVEAFRQKILTADSVLFGSPEYNYSVTGPLKNAIDWASRPPNLWADKTAAILSAGGGFGGGRSQYHLRQIGVYLDLHFINKPEFFLNAFQSPAKFDSDGNLIDAATKERIKASIPTYASTGDVLAKDIRWCIEQLNKNVLAHDSNTVMKYIGDWDRDPRCFPLGDFDGAIITMGSIPRFPMYKNDFGWGKPFAVRNGWANKFDGKISATPGRNGGGSIDLEVVFALETMAALEFDPEFMEYVLGY
ncbi:NAD(P)H dehydrogenase (quinone) [Forsythia ovata]|uniref:NAD(P)H dehydrogenase (quinone) n=1 Tax=Forsythia ovata TaxID=205694 RepID=A0ABD1VHP7_9LAMI